MLTRPSRAEREREQARIHLTRAQVLEATNAANRQLRETIAPAVAVAARDARDWAVPKAAEAKAWAGPKAHDAKLLAAPYVERGLEAAAPRLEAAIERLTPAVDAAHDKIVDELLPRVVEAINAATTAAAGAGAATGVAAATAKKRGSDAAAVLRGEAVVKRRRSSRRYLLLLTVIAAAAGAAFAAFKRQSPQEDPWAVPPGSYPSPSGESSTGATAETTTAATSGDPLASGDASDALGGTGNSIADPDVPGLTTDSGSSTSGTVDPLTSPIEDVEGQNNTGGRA